jgi:hypothetical protein
MSGKIVPYSTDEEITALLRGPEQGRFREGDYIHVSDIISKCTRKIALSHRLSQPIDPEPIFDSQGITFAQGEAIHDYMTNKVIRKHPKKVYGEWSCKCGQSKQIGVRTAMVTSCSVCDGELDKYGELVIVDEELMVSGAVDLTMIMDGAFYLTEIKSKKHELWEKLSRPEPDHVIQILMYWNLAKRKGMSLHDKVSIIYATKNYIFKNPYKEFVLCPSDILHRLEEYMEDARVLKASIHDDGPLPRRIVCPSNNAPAAKKCQFCHICFSME